MTIPKLGFFLISLALFCLSSGYAQDPARMVQRALLCFNNKLVREFITPHFTKAKKHSKSHSNNMNLVLPFSQTQIYSGCDEEYRLTASGNINVPPQVTDQFCNGPCLAETQQLLSCINNLFSDFRFDNKATIRAVSDTIRAGCSFSRQRGIFNVAEYTSPAPSIPFSIGLLYGCIVLGLYLLFL